MRINGKWYFNEVFPYEDAGMGHDVFHKINFISGGSEYDEIQVQYYNGLGANESVILNYNLWRDATIIPIKATESYSRNYGSGGWHDEAYRTIDFGAAHQEVSDDFYNWLTANAVQLSNPIPMTHPKGIRLLTKGKKCTEDIEVVPTFETIETVTIQLQNMGADYIGQYTAFENGTVVTKEYSYCYDNATESINNVVVGSLFIAKSNTGMDGAFLDLNGTTISPFIKEFGVFAVSVPKGDNLIMGIGI